jgi:hypothetical protein
MPADVASEMEQKMEVAAQALLQTFLDRATLAKVNFSLFLSPPPAPPRAYER